VGDSSCCCNVRIVPLAACESTSKMQSCYARVVINSSVAERNSSILQHKRRSCRQQLNNHYYVHSASKGCEACCLHHYWHQCNLFVHFVDSNRLSESLLLLLLSAAHSATCCNNFTATPVAISAAHIASKVSAHNSSTCTFVPRVILLAATCSSNCSSSFTRFC
jgi:hypothetical protein